MQYLKNWEEIFEGKDKSKKKKSKKEEDPHKKIRKHCEKFGIQNYEIDEDGFVNVPAFNGDIQTRFMGEELPFHFGRLDVGLDLVAPNLTSLQGFPHTILGHLLLRECKIKSLEGLPKSIGGDFRCYFLNNLTTLKGGPSRVEFSFVIVGSKIESLEGGPIYVGHDYVVRRTLIKNLKGSPKVIGNDLHLEQTLLTSLEGGPETVKGQFCCNYSKIKNLKGGPKSVGRSYYCNNNELTSLEGSPKIIDGVFDCEKNFLTDLIGGPEEVTGLNLDDNAITSLDGFPKIVHKPAPNPRISLAGGATVIIGDNPTYSPYGMRDSQIDGTVFIYRENPLSEISKLFDDFSDFLASLDYRYIKKVDDDWFIVEYRFREALDEFNIDFPNFLIHWNYIDGNDQLIPSKIIT